MVSSLPTLLQIVFYAEFLEHIYDESSYMYLLTSNVKSNLYLCAPDCEEEDDDNVFFGN